MPIPPLGAHLAEQLQRTAEAADAIHRQNLETAERHDPQPPAPAPEPPADDQEADR